MTTEFSFRTRRLTVSVSLLSVPVWALFLCTRPLGVVLSFAAAVLLHETGHAAVLLFSGIPVQRIAIGIFGIRILPARRLLSYRREVLLFLSGPAVNLLSAASVLLLPPCTGFRPFAACSLLLGGYNLLPAVPLDGGRALSAFLSARLPAQAAARTVDRIREGTAFAVFCIGSAVLLYTASAAPRGVLPAGSLFCIGLLLFFSPGDRADP